eukprot:TRINITY_DN7626_c0_g1_i1.p1 TRINITY_DN7626_c0_g1~~TRINITY_DN7626_c0_g1_i1.p1  ORF type:complete len:313 (-),score=45.07 TRINITY_DN7626_c0_g1_i1:66-893(-)
MAMMHYHTSDEPPLRLFLNDGGLVECLGLISLLRRRCKFMLVTDATADFTMQFVCLRESMKIAMAEKICTFFDPKDPRRGVEPLLADFASSQDSFLRLSVLYDCWGPNAEEPQERRVGEIFFIRMRILEGFHINMDKIKKQEVVDVASCRVDPEASHMESMATDVGGCCCDCCHTRCNCGLVGRFPNIANGNQFLTPMQFALLCRLGYSLADEAVESMTACQATAAAARTAEAAVTATTTATASAASQAYDSPTQAAATCEHLQTEAYKNYHTSL